MQSLPPVFAVDSVAEFVNDFRDHSGHMVLVKALVLFAV